MPNYGEHRAWITVDGEELQEFEVKVEAPPLERAGEDPVVVSCWVPSELGKVCQYFPSEQRSPLTLRR